MKRVSVSALAPAGFTGVNRLQGLGPKPSLTSTLAYKTPKNET